MTTCLGHANPRITEAAAAQAAAIPYAYNHHFTNRPQELLADRLVATRPADGPGQAHLRWVGGQRGRAATRSQLPHRTRRRRPLAGDLAGSGLPRGDHGRPGAERPAHPAAPARRLPGAPPASAAEQLALRPDRPGCSRRSRRGPRRGGSGDRRRGLLRARRWRRVARPCRAGPVLGRLGGTSRTVRIPRLLRRGRQRGRPGRQLVRRRATPDRARHRHDRQEPRRGPRSGGSDAVQRPGLRGDRGREPRVRPRSHLGRRAPAVCRSVSRWSTRSMHEA